MNKRFPCFNFVFTYIMLMASLCYATPVVWYQLPTVKVFKDSSPAEGFDFTHKPLKLYAAAREYEPMQLVVSATDEDITALDIAIGDFKGLGGTIPGTFAEVFQVGYVYIESQRSDLPQGWNWFPDPLIPFPGGGIQIRAGENQPLWIRWYIPPGIAPGIYCCDITLRAVNFNSTIPIELEVFAFELPLKTHTKSAFGIWSDQILKHFNLQAGTPEAEIILDKYYQFQLEHRFMPRSLPIPFSDPRADSYLDDPRLNAIACPFSENEDELRQTVEYLKSGGWDKKAYFYVFDEPGPSQYPRIQQVGDYMHRVAPEIPNLVTVSPKEELVGYVDIWVPPNYTFTWRSNLALQRRAAGDGMWWYWCGSAPSYPTYTINDFAVSPRVLAWFRYRFSIEGELYWATTVYSRLQDGVYKVPIDVWEDPQTGTGYGDGMLIYPGSKIGIQGPVGSIRTEMIREGMEDGEYFWIYEQARGNPPSAEERLGLTQSVCWDLNMGFEKTGANIYDLRLQIARLIEELNHKAWPSFQTDYLLYPLADAHVVEKKPGSNYGGQSWFGLFGTPGYRQEAFLKFRPGLIGTTSSLTSATFSAVMYMVEGENPPEVGLYICDFNWSENDITWASVPRNNLNEYLVAKAQPNQNGRIYFQITDPEALQLLKKEEITFLMRQIGSGNFTSWYTREHGWDARIPYLSLEGRFVKPPIDIKTGLVGQVTNMNKQLLPGTKISCNSIWALSGSNGWYLLPLSPGTYSIAVEKNGFFEQVKVIEVVAEALTQFDFQLLENETVQIFGLKPNPFSLQLDEVLIIDHKLSPESTINQIEIFNLNGALIDRFSPKTPEWSTWTGRDINGRRVTAGLYVCRISYLEKGNSIQDFKQIFIIIP